MKTYVGFYDVMFLAKCMKDEIVVEHKLLKARLARELQV